MTEEKNKPAKAVFTQYQVFVIAILAILHFTIILDFMVLSPLGAILLKEINLTTSQFGFVVSAYAISAGISGVLAAGFADKFDRKKLLLFFYTGFVGGTVLCAMAPNYEFLLMARIVTGIFGGVIGSISIAIITDLFPMEVRGRVMGFIQMAFAASQILGMPIGLLLANELGWHAPFWMIAAFAAAVGIIILVYLKPVNEHLKIKNDTNAFKHLFSTVSNTEYLRGFLATILLATGGFMLMPFGSAFSTNNLKISMDDLPMVYAITGVFTIIMGPLIGIVSDKIGKFNMFVVGTAISIIMVAIWANLGATPLWQVIILNVVLFVGIMSRMVPSSALLTAVPSMKDRGAFMAINSAIQQLAGGLASIIAGMIVIQQTKTSPLENYDVLCYTVIGTMLVALIFMYRLNVLIAKKLKAQTPAV